MTCKRSLVRVQYRPPFQVTEINGLAMNTSQALFHGSGWRIGKAIRRAPGETGRALAGKVLRGRYGGGDGDFPAGCFHCCSCVSRGNSVPYRRSGQRREPQAPSARNLGQRQFRKTGTPKIPYDPNMRRIVTFRFRRARQGGSPGACMMNRPQPTVPARSACNEDHERTYGCIGARRARSK